MADNSPELKISQGHELHSRTVILDKPLPGKKAWEDEQFSYFGLTFDVHKAEQIIAGHPREARVAPRAFLQNFVSEENSVDLVGTNEEHLKTVDITKPGIVAEITHAANARRGREELKMGILIDGNHRAKQAMQEGKEFKVYVLTAQESWEVMSRTTPTFLLKNYVNPNKKPRQSRTAAKNSLIQVVEGLRESLAARAQKVYDEWDQNEEGLDEELGAGGICDQISEEMTDLLHNVLWEHFPRVRFREGSPDGDFHSWVAVSTPTEACGVDIPYQTYETGGGYSWKKKPGVVFSADDVEVFPIPVFEKEEFEDDDAIEDNGQESFDFESSLLKQSAYTETPA